MKIRIVRDLILSTKVPVQILPFVFFSSSYSFSLRIIVCIVFRCIGTSILRQQFAIQFRHSN